MKKIFLSLMLCFSVFAEETPKILMESISKHAIVIGHGPEKAYVFVDPICPRSRAYISLINGRKDLHEKKSYHIFLHPLKRFHSEKLIQHIYQSEDPKNTLEDIMVKNTEVDVDKFEATKNTLEVIEEITVVATQMHMTRRPYQILFELKSNFCRVTEGEAACTESASF